MSNDNVEVVVEGSGEVKVIPDIDLRLEIPASKLTPHNNTPPFAHRMLTSLRRRLQRRRRPEEGGDKTGSHVMLIRDTVAVRDAEGRLYDMEMDLKVEVDMEQQNKEAKAVKKSRTFPFAWMRSKNNVKSSMDVSKEEEDMRNKTNLTATKSLDFIDLNSDVISGLPSAGFHSLNYDGQQHQEMRQQSYNSLPYITRSTMDLFRFTTV